MSPDTVDYSNITCTTVTNTPSLLLVLDFCVKVHMTTKSFKFTSFFKANDFTDSIDLWVISLLDVNSPELEVKIKGGSIAHQYYL